MVPAHPRRADLRREAGDRPARALHGHRDLVAVRAFQDHEREVVVVRGPRGAAQKTVREGFASRATRSPVITLTDVEDYTRLACFVRQLFNFVQKFPKCTYIGNNCLSKQYQWCTSMCINNRKVSPAPAPSTLSSQTTLDQHEEQP